MAVIIINHNSTETMTRAMVEEAGRAAPGIVFEGVTSHGGPPAIQGADDGARATPALLELVGRASDAGAQGIIIGCFDDTALAEAVRRAACPVIGIGQAAYHLAALRGWRFSVVTTLPVSVPVIETNIASCGFGPLVARVRASDVPVLALETNPDAAETAIVAEAKQAQASDGIDALVLGCAGMVRVTRAVAGSVQVPVIDPVSAAARCIGWLMPAAAPDP